MSIQAILSGSQAFYNQPDYIKSTCNDFSKTKPLPTIYTWDSASRIVRIIKELASIIFFPVIVHRLLHSLVGKVFFLPASTPQLYGFPKNYAQRLRNTTFVGGDWKYKRFTIEVDGYKIDTVIMGKESTFNNGRWILASNGNCEFYENKLRDHNFKEILTKLNGNAIVFNYPSVSASPGLPNKQTMAKAYRAVLNFLEDQKKGIGAKEIIGYGHSIGGGVQGDVLKTHQLKDEVKYVFVKSRSFSDLSTTASCMTIRPLGFLVKILGWNLDSVQSSKKMKAPEIIMQTAKVNHCEVLQDSSKIIDDKVIPAKASLAKALLDDPSCPKHNKVFIGMPETHNEDMKNFTSTFMVDKINELLAKQNFKLN